MFDLIQDASHLGIDSLFRLREDAIEPGKYSNLNHIGRLCGWELLSTPHTMSFCHVLTTLIFSFNKESLHFTGPDPLFHLLQCSFRQKLPLLSPSVFPCHLTGKKELRMTLQLKGLLQQSRGVDKGIPVH